MFSTGDTVNYHSIIGEGITSTGHVITHISLMPNNFGCAVAWMTGKTGCVALDALSNDANPPVPESRFAKTSRSKKRYQAYLNADSSETFFAWLKNPFWNEFRTRHGA